MILRPGSDMSTEANRNLSAASASLDKSLSRLSSGSRIVAASDDAGGVAVEMNLAAIIKRLGAVEKNLMNADSFVRVQDDALKTVGDLVTRMGELKTLSLDPTKSQTDIANYATEYWKLAAHIRATGQRTFNGIPLFSSTDKEEFLYCQSRQEGGQTIELVLPPLKEPSLLDVFGEHIYRVISGVMDWENADSDARSKGGHLATITSSDEWKEVLWQLGETVTADPLWVGLQQSGGPEPAGGWRWITNEILAYTKWMPGEPDNDGFTGSGGAADALAWNLHPDCRRWYDDEKTATLSSASWDGGYLLEYWADATKTSKVYEMVVDDLNWNDARDAAYLGKRSGKADIPASLEPHLANISSESELADAKAQLTSAGALPSYNKLWLGGYQPAGVVEPPATNGWTWLPDVKDGVVIPPWTVPNGQQSSNWYMGKVSNGADIWGPWCVNQPDNIGDATPDAWAGYISGPYGEWADSVYTDQVNKGIKGYLLEKDNDFSKIPMSGIVRTLEWVAHYRAQCGAESMQIQIATDSARVASVNLESARSKIGDVDVAAETVSLTRSKVLVESGAKMLQSAHDAMQVVLKLLQPGGSGR